MSIAALYSQGKLMKFISLLLALLIIGFLITKKLGGNDSTIQVLDSNNAGHTLSVPKEQSGLQKFEKEINEFVLDTAEQRKTQSEDVLSH